MNTQPARRRQTLRPRLLARAITSALGMLALGVAPVALAQSQGDFASMVQMQAGLITLPDGSKSQWSGAKNPVIGRDADGRPLMSIEQTQQKALLDWEQFKLQANEVLEYQQKSADWIAVNRVHGKDAAEVHGEIRAKGRVFILNDNGVLIGKDAKINVRQLVTAERISDVNVDGKTTTLVQSADKAIVNWSDMSLQADEVLRLQQQKKDWVALHRSNKQGTTRLDGNIQADGHIVLVAPQGMVIDGKIKAAQVTASALDIRDRDFHRYKGTGYVTKQPGLVSSGEEHAWIEPTFSNNWKYLDGHGGGIPTENDFLEILDTPPSLTDADDPLRYRLTVGQKGEISTDPLGRIMLFGPYVNNRGRLNVQDEGRVIIAAGENVFINGDGTAFASGFRAARSSLTHLAYAWFSSPVVKDERWQRFFKEVMGLDLQVGQAHGFGTGQYASRQIAQKAQEYYARKYQEYALARGYTARNEGIISAKGGGQVQFVGMNMEQMGSIEMTSTASFRGTIKFQGFMQDMFLGESGENAGGCGTIYAPPCVEGNGTVVFGKNSLTQITPDLESKDTLPVTTEGQQFVGTLKINAGKVHMQEGSLIYMPSGDMRVLLDAKQHVFDNNRGEGANQDMEDGTRFMMERGATIDLSGWTGVTLPMGFHQVTGKLFAAQFSDAPMQRDGALYRKEISVDRRYGTNVANWQGLDNLNQATLPQFLINGGRLSMDINDDFIMKDGALIDVSGGKITYQDGYVYTTLLRRLDGSVIDIREADPDELYMGLANQYTVYDTKWGRQQDYYIPLMSSSVGKFETSYEHGGNAGTINIMAPDMVLQGALKGTVTAGRYQRLAPPKMGVARLNADATGSEVEYSSKRLLLEAKARLIGDAFSMNDKLSDKYGTFFGKEFGTPAEELEPGEKPSSYAAQNATLVSQDFFNRSQMGEFRFRVGADTAPGVPGYPLAPGFGVRVEDGVDLQLGSASFILSTDNRVQFLGSIRTAGGDINLGGAALEFSAKTRLDTRGAWYSDYEVDEPVALAQAPRIHGGKISLGMTGLNEQATQQVLEGMLKTGDLDYASVLPKGMVIDSSGGGYADQSGKITLGKGGDLNITLGHAGTGTHDLSALADARALGLGGNGKFSLITADNIFIGTGPTPDPVAFELDFPTAPEPEEGEEPAPAPPTLLRHWQVFAPGFFDRSGFSAIALSSAGDVMVEDGAQLPATSAALEFKDQTLLNGRLPALWAKSGTDIFEIAQVGTLPFAQRPQALRRGMDVSLTALQTLSFGKGASLVTEAGGKLALTGASVAVDGTLNAPGGQIGITGIGTGGSGSIDIGASARLLAAGTSYITSDTVVNGQRRVQGVLLPGGKVSMIGDNITLAEGALVDVSGTTATFDLPGVDAHGNAVVAPRTLSSNAGEVELHGRRLDFDSATFKAAGGDARARGGGLTVTWQGGEFGSAERNPWDPKPETLYQSISWMFDYGYVTDADGNPVNSMFGVDLSTLSFPDWWGELPPIAPGTRFENEQAMVDLLTAYEAAAGGLPPMFRIGENLAPVEGGGSVPHIDPGLRAFFEKAANYKLPEVSSGLPAVTDLSPSRVTAAGFSRLNLASDHGFIFFGDVQLGGKGADGRQRFERIALNAPQLIAGDGANVTIQAGRVDLLGGVALLNTDKRYQAALAPLGILPVNETKSALAIHADRLLQVQSAQLHGFTDTHLSSGGDIRLTGHDNNIFLVPKNPWEPVDPDLARRPAGQLKTGGNLTLKADQIYAATGADFRIDVGDTLTTLAQDDGGPINGTPYEAAASLTLTAARIDHGGVLRSPLGTINIRAVDGGSEGAGSVILRPGSLLSVSADGRQIPYGFTTNGDTWRDPFTGRELTVLPVKTVNVEAETLDMQADAVIDTSGGGDLVAREFVPGLGGTRDWLTGYFDRDMNWVEAPGRIYAVIPGYAGDVAPAGTARTGLYDGVGDQVYLSGGSGLEAGVYTLLPAEYAIMPGAFRVTLAHDRGDFTDMLPGQHRPLTDGSSIQAGYRIDGASGQGEQRNAGWLVMPGRTLRMRSHYNESSANSFFTSAAYLNRALRLNRPIGDVPRTPLDGGGLALRVRKELDLSGRYNSAAAKGGRGGYADIAGERIVVAAAGTDMSGYDGWLQLDSAKLTGFGASSLLLGGLRSQGQTHTEVDVVADQVVVDNAGAVLSGPELLFAATGEVLVKSGSQLQAKGELGGKPGNLLIRPYAQELIDPQQPWSKDDDILLHPKLDQGALLRLSAGAQIDILRDQAAVDALHALAADPARLAAANQYRATLGLPPLVLDGGALVVESGASLQSVRSLTLDATRDTVVQPGAALDAKQLSAASSRVSFGAVPAGTGGLVFSGSESLAALTRAEELRLKSYGSIDFHGPLDLVASDSLHLDSRSFNLLDADGKTVSIRGKRLTFGNSQGGSATAQAGGATLKLSGENVYFTGGDKAFGGVGLLDIQASQRVIGEGKGTVRVPGALQMQAGGIAVESGGQLYFDASGKVAVTSTGGTLPDYKSFGASFGIVGDSVDFGGALRLTGGNVSLQARRGDVVLGKGAQIDVTSNTVDIFDRKVGVGAGSVSLVADRGNIDLQAGSRIDVSGTAAGGDAGEVVLSAGQGAVRLDGELRGSAVQGARSGSISMLTAGMQDFGGLNKTLDAGGFRQKRRFEVNQGDLAVDGVLEVQEFEAVANDGAIRVTGTVRTPGAQGGRIHLADARGLSLESGARLLAAANAADGAGGTVRLETSGRGGGVLDLKAGSLIDVSGHGAGGRTVDLRAPQMGGGMALGAFDGQIKGARKVTAEAYRVYDGVDVIDEAVIGRVQDDAAGFMAGANALRGRLAGKADLAVGIELRSDGDMRLSRDWDLHQVRFDGAAGVLTLRAGGDLLIDGNLSDGFDGAGTDAAPLAAQDNWSINLVAGANTASPDTLATRPMGLLDGKGSLVIGGTPDTIEYFQDPKYGNESRLYLRDPDTGLLMRNPSAYNPYEGWYELKRDPATGKYLDPKTGQPIEKDPATGDYADAAHYARRPMPWFWFDGGGYKPNEFQDGSPVPRGGQEVDPRLLQRDNSTGNLVRTGTGAIQVAASRDLVLKERASVIYTAGARAEDLPGFHAPKGAQYTTGGGDLSVRVGQDVRGEFSNTVQLPSRRGWLKTRQAYNSIGQFQQLPDGGYGQTTWHVAFPEFQGGLGALGGGNVTVNAGRDLRNLGVAIPTIGRTPGNIGEDTVVRKAVIENGGNLDVRAGRDIAGGVFLVGQGQARIHAGGAIVAGNPVTAVNRMASGPYYNYSPNGPTDAAQVTPERSGLIDTFDLYPVLYTSNARFDVSAGGDIHLDGIHDPLLLNVGDSHHLGPIYSFGDQASLRLFSAGGDVTLWNNGQNLHVASLRSAAGHAHWPARYSGATAPDLWNLTEGYALSYRLYPHSLTAVAAAGSVRVLGGMVLAPSARGQLELLAGQDVQIGYNSTPSLELYPTREENAARNWRGVLQGIVMSQAKPDLLPGIHNPGVAQTLDLTMFTGTGKSVYGGGKFDLSVLPDLHLGDREPVRVYALHGSVIGSPHAGSVYDNLENQNLASGALVLPKAARVQAGSYVYFPEYRLQHNHADDLSVVRGGKGVYLYEKSTIAVAGPGQLEVESGGDLWIPDNALGITSKRLQIWNDSTLSEWNGGKWLDWKPEEDGAAIGLAVGYNRQPAYDAFADAYFNPEKAGAMADYLKDEKGTPIYLFDREYPRAAGASGDYAKPEHREGLVNFVRRMQGLEPIADRAGQEAWLGEAWAGWQALEPDRRIAFFREVLMMELRTTGREATNPENDRFNTTFRGYDAIATLFPGAQKRADAALTEGESRWEGGFETYASRVLSQGGGKIEVMVPGGGIILANSAATAAQTGQGHPSNPRGDALRAGMLTTNGGEINVFTGRSITINNSRVLTAKGGNLLMWSSYGDIAAGKGAKTSISPQFYDYRMDNWLRTDRQPAGLPTGAGIGTLATQPGTPPADVDLIAPNGIIDAGDAGIRVSGNFNVFAVQILGTDNIDVSGVATGLPTPPAAPPTSLDVGDVGAKASEMVKQITDAVAQVRKDNSTPAPSIVEVRVTGYGDECLDADGKPQPAERCRDPQRR